METPGSQYDQRYIYPTPSSTVEECMEMVVNNAGVVTRNLLKRMRDSLRYRGYEWNSVTHDWTPYVEWRNRLLGEL